MRAIIPKGHTKIAKISKGHICLREENLRFDRKYIIILVTSMFIHIKDKYWNYLFNNYKRYSGFKLWITSWWLWYKEYNKDCCSLSVDFRMDDISYSLKSTFFRVKNTFVKEYCTTNILRKCYHMQFPLEWPSL